MRSPVGSFVVFCHQWWQGACYHLLCVSREEAKEMWEKREAEWARERSARDRLMSEVIVAASTYPAKCSGTQVSLVILKRRVLSL